MNAKRFSFFILLLSILNLHAQDTQKGPRLSDQQFFELLDLSRPELASVKQAIAQSDLPAAKHAFATEIRARSMPRWDVDPLAIGKDPKYNASAARNAIHHRFTSIDIPWQFGSVIDWKFNPTTAPDSKWPRNHEWTWQLSRHRAWLDLARAFYATGDEQFAREFVAELQSWVADCPVPVKSAENVAFSRWRTIEAGIRTGTVWPEVFPRFLAAKAFDDDALCLMVKSFVEHAQYLMKFHTKGNWLTMEANGLYHVGALFPEFKDAKLWRDTATDRLDTELDFQVYPDGAQIELTPGYHGVALRNFLGPVDLISSTGFSPPADYLPKIEKMFAYYLYSMQPTRKSAPLNDASAQDIRDYLKQGSELFPKRADLEWAASGGRQGAAPDHTSHEFPYAGQFYMRGGWDSKALWLCMDGGPFGFGHQHEDKLSVLVTAYGKQLLVEGGTYTYDASEWRHYVLSSRAHNVVLVDGLEQNRRKSPAATYVTRTPLPHIWETNERFDHAAAFYNEGWGSKAGHIVTHIRHVFYVKPDLFVIVDELQPSDEKSHTYDALFHLDAPEAEIDGLKVSTKQAGPNLSITAFGADTVSIVKGQKEPVVQGWIPDYSGDYGAIRPIPTAIYRKSAPGKVTMFYALYPSPKAAEFPVTNLLLEGGELKISYATGKQVTLPFHELTPASGRD